MPISESYNLEETDSKSMILARHAQAASTSKGWHDRIRGWRKLYDMDHYKTPKRDNEHFPDPTPTNVVDLATGIIGSNDLEFRAIGWQRFGEEEKGTSKVEKFLQGVLALAVEREDSNIPYDATFNFVRDGSCVLYSVWDTELQSKFLTTAEMPLDPSEGGEGSETVPAFEELPVVTRVIDPLLMTMIPGGANGRWSVVFRTEKMTVYDAEWKYGVRPKQFAHLNKEQAMLTYGRLIDYWRRTSMQMPTAEIGPDGAPVIQPKDVIINAVLFETEYIIPPRVMEGYEDLPYTFGWFKPVDKSTSKDWSHSIISPLEESVRHLEVAINRRAHQIDVYSQIPMVVKSEGGRTVMVEGGAQNVKTIGLQEDIAYPIWPGTAPDVAQHIDFLRSRLQQAGFSDVMYGAASASAGYAMAQLGDMNRIRLEQPIKHLEMMWSVWSRKVLRMTKNFATDAVVRVYGKYKGRTFRDLIKGGDVGDYMVRAMIKAKFPQDQIRNHAFGTQTAGVLSLRTRMEKYYDIEQPDDEFDRIQEEQFEMQPAMQQYRAMEFLMRLQAGGDRAAAMTLASMAQGGGQMGNPGGRPKEPNNPAPQPAGNPSPGGQEPPQAAGNPPPGQSFMEELQAESTKSPGMSGVIQ